MTVCTPDPMEFSRCKRRKVEVEFTGGAISSDGGILLLQRADQRLKLTERLASCLQDPREAGKCRHPLPQLLRQRIYGLAQGYADLNDHNRLRTDPLIQTAVGSDAPLASAPTLCRLENRVSRKSLVRLSEFMVELFIESFAQAPQELILDFDATDDRVHGEQVGAFFHGYYDHACFLPLYVFCGQKLLVAYLRPGNADPAQHAWAILALLVKRFRAVWPGVRIIFRADSGFCRRRMLGWCEKNGVDYIVGIAGNKRLEVSAKPLCDQAKQAYERTAAKQRLFSEVSYAADTWKCSRRVLVKAEYQARGANTRYVVTSLAGDPQALYDKLYCARGEMENRIKEQQRHLFADRTSCMNWLPNQFRLLLASLAYGLMEILRNVGCAGTELARAQCETLRLRLLKIGAIILRNTRRVRIFLASGYPWQALFRTVARQLGPA